MTLVELLVVIVLLTTLVTTAIPIISPGGESRKLREASRGINSYLQGAQVRAMQTGRPFGVALRRLSADTGRGADNAVCAQLRYVEVPPAYAGFSETSVVRLARNPVYNPSADPNNEGDDDKVPFLIQMLTRGPTTAGLPSGWQADLIPPRFLRPGDLIEIAGQRYAFSESDGTSAVLLPTAGEEYFDPQPSALNTFGVASIDKEPLFSFEYDSQGRRLPDTAVLAAGATTTSPAGWTGAWPVLPSDQPFWTEPKPYKIYRQPVEAGGEPLELPSGVAIDLQASAFGTIRTDLNRGRLYSPHVDFNPDTNDLGLTVVRKDDVMVLFAPEGNIQRVYNTVRYDGTEEPSRSVTDFLALCVGRRELIPALRPAGLTTTTRAEYAEPIDLLAANVSSLSETEAREVTDKYNWLNLESRWVVIGGPSGAITTVENSAVYPGPRTDLNDDNVLSVNEQIAAALENAPRRTSLGGR